MSTPSRSALNVEVVVGAFQVMGVYLRERGVVGEIAVYGGAAILLQFPWRRATKDVDVTIGSEGRESAVKDAAAHAAIALGLPDDWLNNAVGAFTPEVEPDEYFLSHGTYPREGPPGLRVFLAKPEYLCAMKLAALERENVGDKDFDDAVALALQAGISTVEQLDRLFTSFFPEERLNPNAAARLPEVAEAIRRSL